MDGVLARAVSLALLACSITLHGCGGAGGDTTTTTTTIAPTTTLTTITTTTTTTIAPTTTLTTITTTSTTVTTTSTTTPAPTTPAPSIIGRASSEVVKVPGWRDLPRNFPESFVVKTNNMVYVTEMGGFDMHNRERVSGGVGPQTNQTLMNVRDAVTAAGSSMEEVVKCSVFMVDIANDFKAMNEVYATFWPKDPPARVAVQVASLEGYEKLLIQCDAALSAKKVVKVPGWPDLKGFPLSFATTANGMVFLSGSQGLNMSTMKLVDGGVGPQTTQTLANLKEVLLAAGSSPDRVTGCSVSLTDINDFEAMNDAYKAFWPKEGILGGLPSRVCVEVGALAGAGKVEIQCIAASADMPADKAPKVVKVPGWPDLPLPFSSAVTAGDMAYISGNQGVDMKTFKLVPGGAGPETTQTLKNIQEAVEAAGGSLVDVVSCEVSLQDIKSFQDLNKAYAAFWPKDPPSRIVVQVGALAKGANVEIRCLAALPVKSSALQASRVIVV